MILYSVSRLKLAFVEVNLVSLRLCRIRWQHRSNLVIHIAADGERIIVALVSESVVFCSLERNHCEFAVIRPDVVSKDFVPLLVSSQQLLEFFFNRMQVRQNNGSTIAALVSVLAGKEIGVTVNAV